MADSFQVAAKRNIHAGSAAMIDTVGVTLQPPKYQINVNTLEHIAVKTLEGTTVGPR